MKFHFEPHLIETELEGPYWAQTALADLDSDGRLEYVVGKRFGDIYAYKYHSPGEWTRHLIGEESPGDVGLCVMDVDGDGHLDLVSAGTWYRNPGDFSRPFERIPYDPELPGGHDILKADLDGDGRDEVVVMTDQKGVSSTRFYRIPEDPTSPWESNHIAPATHSGLAVGDVDGDGALDVVRATMWFRNVDGDASRWDVGNLGQASPPPMDFQHYFTFDATKSAVCDINADGKNDIVLTDAEIPGGKIWWLENVNGDGSRWKRHDVPNGDGRRRGAYHSLHVADFDGDGDLDIFSCEMEAVAGDGQPGWFLWENLDGKGGEWKEHQILDGNLGGHETVVGDVTGNGKLDIISKPWNSSKENALGGKMYVMFLENLSD